MANDKIINVEVLNAYGDKIKRYVDNKDTKLQTNITNLSTEVAGKANSNSLGTLATKSVVDTSDLAQGVQQTLEKVSEHEGDISGIEKKIPTAASETNQLADKAWVNTNAGKIDKIQKNGTDLPVTNKVVNITVPTQASDIGAEAAFTKNTAFNKNFATSAPAANGTANAGSTNTVSRGDHVHPIDTTRAAKVHNHETTDILGLNTALTDIRNVAQGKTATYVLDVSNTLNNTLNTSDDRVACPSAFYNANGTLVVRDVNLKKGDILLLIPTDIPDRWYGGDGYLYKMETTKVDLTDYVPKNEIMVDTNVITDGINLINYAVPMSAASFDEAYNGYLNDKDATVLYVRNAQDNIAEKYSIVGAYNGLLFVQGKIGIEVLRKSGTQILKTLLLQQRDAYEMDDISIPLGCYAGALPATHNSIRATINNNVKRRYIKKIPAYENLDEFTTVGSLMVPTGAKFIEILTEDANFVRAIESYSYTGAEVLKANISLYNSEGDALYEYEVLKVKDNVYALKLLNSVSDYVYYTLNGDHSAVTSIEYCNPLERATIADLTDIWTTT